MPDLRGGQKFSFPTLFDFYREVFLRETKHCLGTFEKAKTGSRIYEIYIFELRMKELICTHFKQLPQIAEPICHNVLNMH